MATQTFKLTVRRIEEGGETLVTFDPGVSNVSLMADAQGVIAVLSEVVLTDEEKQQRAAQEAAQRAMMEQFVARSGAPDDVNIDELEDFDDDDDDDDF